MKDVIACENSATIDGGGKMFQMWMKCSRRSVIGIEAGLLKATK
jgi:hypothetical protein